MELKDITVGQEHFSGYLTRTFEDDKFYVIAGHNHASVVEVIGLDQFKRLGGPLVVSVDDLVKTQEWEKNRQQEKVYERSPVIDCYRLAPSPAIDGRSDDWPTVSAELPGRARFRIGYDDHNLYLCYETGGMGPLKNSGQQWDRLFKTGAAADLQIATDPAAPEDRKAPVAGDQRLLMTYMNGKPIAVLYNAVVPGTPADQVWQAISPVAKVYFDKVEKRDDVRLATSRAGYGYVLEAAVPLAALGLKPEPNLRLKIDWGVLVTDEEGNAVLRREYWANKATGIIADVPSEAMLNPSLWGHVLFHGAGGQLAERLPKPDFEPRDPTMDKMLQEFEGELEDDLP